MRELVERAYFASCLAVGRVLRSARYATAQVVARDGQRVVRKRRRAFAPLLVWLNGALVRLLRSGVRVLPQRAWEERERWAYHALYAASIQVDRDGSLLLPILPGVTLASLLEDRTLTSPARLRAIECAVAALVELHAVGVTHGDAMAENVLVDIECGTARWFDFETVHDARRPMTWRRADDLRALLTTCVVRSAPEQRARTIDIILDRYGDESVVRELSAGLASALRRPLAFHLGQAPMSLRCHREIGRSLRARLGAAHVRAQRIAWRALLPEHLDRAQRRD